MYLGPQEIFYNLRSKPNWALDRLTRILLITQPLTPVLLAMCGSAICDFHFIDGKTETWEGTQHRIHTQVGCWPFRTIVEFSSKGAAGWKNCGMVGN